MNNTNSTQGVAQGAQIPTAQEVATALRQDLSVAQACIHAILSDQDLLNHMATFMVGRAQNVEFTKQVSEAPMN